MPFVSPPTVVEVAVVVAVTPPGDDMTVYSVIAAPVEARAMQETIACALPPIALTPVGTAGVPTMMALEAVDDALVPKELVAVTVNAWDVPFVSPVTVAEVVVVVAVKPPGLEVTV